MTGEQINTLGSILFVGAFVLGVRASWRLTRRYRSSRRLIDERNRPILLAIVWVAWIVTGTVAWIGALSVLRLLLNTTYNWTPPFTLTISFIVALTPVLLDVTISRVADEKRIFGWWRRDIKPVDAEIAGQEKEDTLG